MASHIDVRGYLIVFGALLVLTALTVAASALTLPAGLGMALGLGIAAAKAALVAMFFMHLKYERMLVYVTLAFTSVFCVALFALTLWTEADHVTGTEFRAPFQ